MILTGQGIKICSLSDINARRVPHITATRAALAERLRDEHRVRRGNPKAARHLQTITLAKFTALQRLGCPHPRQEPTDLSEDERQSRDQRDHDLRRGREYNEPRCEGRLHLDLGFKDETHQARARVR